MLENVVENILLDSHPHWNNKYIHTYIGLYTNMHRKAPESDDHKTIHVS